MDEFVKEEKVILKHGWLTQSPSPSSKLIRRWKEKYFVFCEITSGEKRWLHLLCYRNYVAFKSRKMPENYIDISEASEIGIGPEEVSGHRHNIVIQVPGRLHYLSASSCEDMFQWNLALRSSKFDDTSKLQSPIHKSNSLASDYDTRQRLKSVPNDYYSFGTGASEVSASPRDRSKSAENNTFPRSDMDVMKSNMKLRKNYLYCRSCLKKAGEQNTYVNIQPIVEDELDKLKRIADEPLYIEIGSNEELYDEPDLPGSTTYDSPYIESTPKPIGTAQHVYENAPRNQGTEHESDSVLLDALVGKNKLSLSCESEATNAFYGSHPFNYSTVSLPGIYMSTRPPGMISPSKNELPGLPRSSSSASDIYITMGSAEPRRNTDGKMAKTSSGSAQEYKKQLSKTFSVPVLPLSPRTHVTRRGTNPTSLQTESLHSETWRVRTVEDSRSKPKHYTDAGYVTVESGANGQCVQESEDDRSAGDTGQYEFAKLAVTVTASSKEKETSASLEKDTSASLEKDTSASLEKDTSASLEMDSSVPSKQDSSTSLKQDSSASLKQDSSASLKQDSSASLKQDSSASLKQDSSISLKQDSSASLKQDSSALLKQDSSASLKQDSSASLKQDSSASLKQDSSASLKQDSSASLKQDSSASLKQDSSASSKKETSAPLEKDSSTSLKQDISVSLEKDISVSLEKDSSAPLQQDSSASSKKETSAPLEGATPPLSTENSPPVPPRENISGKPVKKISVNGPVNNNLYSKLGDKTKDLIITRV